jgi:hypothetical protein
MRRFGRNYGKRNPLAPAIRSLTLSAAKDLELSGQSRQDQLRPNHDVLIAGTRSMAGPMTRQCGRVYSPQL